MYILDPDMPFIRPGMDRDPLGAKPFTIERRPDHIRDISSPGISQGGYFIDINTQPDHINFVLPWFIHDKAKNFPGVVATVSDIFPIFETIMRVLIQRVSQASVRIGHAEKGRIGEGLLVLLGIEEADQPDDAAWLCGKIVRLRIFDDKTGVMNLSVKDIDGGILIVSQFTLHASTKKGNRPSYIRAARPETAIPLYEKFLAQMELELGKPVQKGEFGAMMQVSLVNDGPVTIFIDSRSKE